MSYEPKLILVVEDNDAVRGLLVSILRARSYVVAEADSGVRALAFLGELTPDLILLDIRPGDMDGNDVMAAIRDRGFKKPILAMAGPKEPVDRGQVCGVVDKPFAADAVLSAVRTALYPMEDAPVPLPEAVRESGFIGANALSLVSVALVLVVVCVQLFVLLPNSRDLAKRQSEIEAVMEERALHEADMREVRKREAANAAKLLLHQELALKLLKDRQR